MTRSATVARPGSQFDNFLFAPIGDERNGMLLSVLSALARLDVDPWLEAASLASMPKETATARMASLIAALPDRPSAQPDTATVAARWYRAVSGLRAPGQLGSQGDAENQLQ